LQCSAGNKKRPEGRFKIYVLELVTLLA
jgi:hypothetical protein